MRPTFPVIDIEGIEKATGGALGGGGRDRTATSRVISSLRDVIPGGGGGAKKQNVSDTELLVATKGTNTRLDKLLARGGTLLVPGGA